MISEKTIQAVRDLDIAVVLKPYVNLTARGSSLVGLCPFHSEKSPSFSVSPRKNLCYCFSCHRGGDGIAFVMEKENCTFEEAVERIARDNNIPLDFTNRQMSDKEIEDAKHRESLMAALDVAQKFFYDSLRITFSDEARNAQAYAYGRWPEEFCSTFGVGYAPKDGRAFMEYCKRKAVDTDLLIELGLLKRDKEDKEKIYTAFRERVIIPIRNRWGRVIAFTGRYIGTNDKAAKYINSDNSEIYTKGDTIFGIDRASRVRDAANVIIVEGAPDVMRFNILGYDNTVATLGTSWTDHQFEQLKKYYQAITFVPDSDVKEGELFGPGFIAVIKNGAEAIRKGFDVTVREIPFAEVELTDEELKELYPDGVPGDAVRIKPGKNDADSYLKTAVDFTSLPEKYFIVWLAEKRFYEADSIQKERNAMSEIADLLRYVKDSLTQSQIIEQLSKIYGKVKMWRDAVTMARGIAQRNKESDAPTDEKQQKIEDLRKAGLFIRNNCYYTIGSEEEDPVIISNFVMEPLFHISDDNNGTRLFKLINEYGDTREMEIRESEMCSLAAFQQKTGTLGNFIWLAKIDKLNRIKRYLYARTDTAERVRKLGWNSEDDFFAFGNGILADGQFLNVDDLGIVKGVNGKAYYIPALAKMYRNNPEIYQFERLMVYGDLGGVSLKGFATKLIEVFGENARIALCYLFATLFRDVIFQKTRHFPILNLFGEKGTGKTTLATCLQSFFIHGVDPPNLSVTSIPAMNDRVSQAVNTLVVFDEYKNDLDVRKVGFLKGLWGGGGQTKKNTNTDGMASQTIVSTGIAICGQDKPTQDMALYTRVLFLEYTKTSFNATERKRYEELVTLCNMGLTHLTVELLKHRRLFEKNFPEAYSMVKREFGSRLSETTIHERISGNWVIALATFRTLETVLDLPFSYSELFETAVKGVMHQNELAQESSEVGDFWNTLQGLQSAGKCVNGVHFRIKYLTKFRAIGSSDDMEYKEPRPILYLNAAAVSSLLGGRSGMGATANRSYWSTILSYLKSHTSYLGLKQQRFDLLLANGSPDYYYETVNGQQVRKQNVTRPQALCFDYLRIKDDFGVSLETEAMTDAERLAEDYESAAENHPGDSMEQDTGPAPDLFNN